LSELQSKQKIKKQIIDIDNQEPIINVFTKQNASNATISGRVTDNTEVADVLINGQAQELSSNGTFETNFYIPRTGKTIEIVAFDIKGNKANKTLKLERDNIQQASGPSFKALNPLLRKVKSNLNALALIIGVADYEKTNANALYADKDAQQFYDYATMKLGVPSSNIKELVNSKADRVEITLAIKDWIARSTKSGQTDIYVFFAGHGLATSDGKDMFLLPYDGLPRLLQDSAIKRDQLFADIQKANPKSVTVFLDTCYSGTTRGTDMLIASRPIAIRALEQSIPNNFTVFSAAAGDQTSKPLEEAKHGMFSYFLMKGMEGDADINADNKITARELHAFVRKNVIKQSSGSQEPELQGDKDRVIIIFD
ncbi:caspase family protein, partial [Alphaproteobacteria bacterium]|nr:caspase family protein [Alphaproteobacteria bacterium]